MIENDNLYTLTNDYDMKCYEIDSLSILKPSALLNHLQDIATKSADKIGIGISYLASKNRAWYLLKYHMEFDNYPQNLEKITVKTESRGSAKLFAIRDFEIWDNNNLLGRASSQWGMINPEDKSFVRLYQEDIIPSMEKREDDLVFAKVNAQSYYNCEKLFEIRYDDIDINQHVNNANYIIWAFEALPYEFRKSHKLKTLDMVYKKEIKFGNNVISKLLIDEKITHHLLINKETDEQLCILDAVWQPIL